MIEHGPSVEDTIWRHDITPLGSRKIFRPAETLPLANPIIAQHKLCLVVQHISRTSYFRARRAQYTTPGWSSSPSARVGFREPGSAAPAETFRQSRDRPTTRG